MKKLSIFIFFCLISYQTNSGTHPRFELQKESDKKNKSKNNQNIQSQAIYRRSEILLIAYAYQEMLDQSENTLGIAHTLGIAQPPFYLSNIMRVINDPLLLTQLSERWPEIKKPGEITIKFK
jgi:hypothetical protein